jgi:ATP-binding cassette subfamily F protein 3
MAKHELEAKKAQSNPGLTRNNPGNPRGQQPKPAETTAAVKTQKENKPEQHDNNRHTSSPADKHAGSNTHAPAPINKETKKELQKQQRRFQQLEDQIGKLNAEKTKLEASLIDPATYSDKTKFLEAETAYKNVSGELMKLTEQYEKTFELIVSLGGS